MTFFQSERLGSGKTLSELYIHCKFHLTRVCYHDAGCKEYCKDFSVALKMFSLVNMKQMYDSVITRKERKCFYTLKLLYIDFSNEF